MTVSFSQTTVEKNTINTTVARKSTIRRPLGKAIESMSVTRNNSQSYFDRAKQLIPGGVNSPARAFGAVGGTPLFIEKAAGAWLTDVDGGRYIDYVASWGPMILGHGHSQVIAAVSQALKDGTSFGAPTLAESELADRIIQMVPSIEKVRLVNSGTEATMSAVRLARGFTGRDLIVKFAGNYHGHVDSLLVAAGSSAATLSVPNSPGVTAGTTKDTLILPFNDVAALQQTFAQTGDSIAAVIVEPVVGNMGCVPPSDAFLSQLQSLTQNHGGLLILDEVMTGFRVAAGGAQERFGIQPDITTLGKIVGGGLPIGAYGGKAEIMDHILPAGRVFQAGTLSGNPLATAAGIATLDLLRELDPYPQLESLSTRLAEGLHQAATNAGIPHCVQRVGSMLTLFFNPGPIQNWDDAAECDTELFGRFFWQMIERGVYLPCSQFEAMFVSAAHDEELIDRTVEAAGESLLALA